jgi:hypothetical protein
MPVSQSFLTYAADLTYPSTGAIGRLILLSGSLATGLQFTVDTATDTLTTVSAHKLVTGSRIRVASSAVLTTPLVATTDYFAIVLSTTTLKLATTLTDANSSTAIDITSNGTGTLTLNEQDLNISDPLSVLLNKELPSANGYSRMLIDNLGAATIVSSNAAKPPKLLTLTNTGSTNLEYKHHLIAYGTSVSATIGQSSGINSYALDTVSLQTTVPGQTRNITLNMLAKPV